MTDELHKVVKLNGEAINLHNELFTTLNSTIKMLIEHVKSQKEFNKRMSSFLNLPNPENGKGSVSS